MVGALGVWRVRGARDGRGAGGAVDSSKVGGARRRNRESGPLQMIVTVLDSCVLYPPSLRDLFMWLAAAMVYQPRWTEDIHSEWDAQRS